MLRLAMMTTSNPSPMPALMETAVRSAQMLFSSAFDLLQEVQALVPAPTLEEIAEMRERKRPLTREAFLLGLLQRVLVGAENLASDLQVIDEEILRDVHQLQLSALEFNAMEEAVTERMSK